MDGNLKGIKVGIITEDLHHELVEPQVRDAVLKATSILGDLGATVDEISLPLARHAGVISGILLNVEAAATHRDWVQHRLDDYGHDNRIGLLTGSLLPAADYYKAQKLRSMLRQQVLEALGRCDVLITPTSGKPAQRIEDDPVITNKQQTSRLGFLFTRVFNLSNTPAISVPCGLSDDNLPLGMQIGGRPGGEEMVLKVAHAYEQQTPWHTLRPPAAF